MNMWVFGSVAHWQPIVATSSSHERVDSGTQTTLVEEENEQSNELIEAVKLRLQKSTFAEIMKNENQGR